MFYTIQHTKKGEWFDLPTYFINDFGDDLLLYHWLGNPLTCYTIAPITPPRGLPTDLIPFVTDDNNYKLCLFNTREKDFDVDSVWLGNFGHSWLLSNEIIEMGHQIQPPYKMRLAPFISYFELLEKKYGIIRMVYGFG